MAGRFRGDVSKVLKPKKSKAARKAKGKKVVSLVKRGRKLPQDALRQRIAELVCSNASHCAAEGVTTIAVPPVVPAHSKMIGKAALEIVGQRTEHIVPREELTTSRTSAQAMGLRMLHQAIKNQSHNKLLPHQNRHDYEYRLRSIATMGVVQLFNSLAQARKAAAEVLSENAHLTAEKALEKKQMISREAFLAALRQPQRGLQY